MSDSDDVYASRGEDEFALHDEDEQDLVSLVDAARRRPPKFMGRAAGAKSASSSMPRPLDLNDEGAIEDEELEDPTLVTHMEKARARLAESQRHEETYRPEPEELRQAELRAGVGMGKLSLELDIQKRQCDDHAGTATRALKALKAASAALPADTTQLTVDQLVAAERLIKSLMKDMDSMHAKLEGAESALVVARRDYEFCLNGHRRLAVASSAKN